MHYYYDCDYDYYIGFSAGTEQTVPQHDGSHGRPATLNCRPLTTTTAAAATATATTPTTTTTAATITATTTTAATAITTATAAT